MNDAKVRIIYRRAQTHMVIVEELAFGTMEKKEEYHNSVFNNPKTSD